MMRLQKIEYLILGNKAKYIQNTIIQMLMCYNIKYYVSF